MLVSLWGMSSLKYPGVVSIKPNIWGLLGSRFIARRFIDLMEETQQNRYLSYQLIPIMAYLSYQSYLYFIPHVHFVNLCYVVSRSNLPPSNVYESGIECDTSSREDQIAIRQFHQRFSRSHTDLEGENGPPQKWPHKWSKTATLKHSILILHCLQLNTSSSANLPLPPSI